MYVSVYVCFLSVPVSVYMVTTPMLISIHLQALPAFMALSDCTYLYLMILDEIIDEGGDTNDGRLIAQKSKGKHFEGNVNNQTK